MSALAWIETVIAIVGKVESAIGQLPRFDGGKLLMPESQSAKAAAELIDATEAADMLLQAACMADKTLHSALVVAALNCNEKDQARILKALKGIG